MPRVSATDCDLYYEEGGVGAPVVYVHGGFASLESALLDLPTDGSSWKWEEDFAKHFRFIEYDRRGCYRSSCPESGYGLLNEARDMECLLDHLSVEGAHLIGSSAGGPVAILFGATRPNRTKSLTLVGTAMNLFPHSDPVGEVIRRQIRILKRQGSEAAFDGRPKGVEVSLRVLWTQLEQAERGTLDEFWASQHTLNSKAEQMPRSQRVLYYAAELRSIKGYMDVDVAEYARKVYAPTLVLHGSNDREVPLAWGEEVAQTIPRAELEVMEGLSHTLVVRSGQARHRVISFISQIEG